MSDFEALLERLLLDPQFKAELVAEPERTLSGYRLDNYERAVLMANMGVDPGLHSRVEQRTSKAGMAGLFSTMSEALFAGPQAAFTDARPGGSAPDPLQAGGGSPPPPPPPAPQVPPPPLAGGGGSLPDHTIGGFNPQPDPPGVPVHASLGGPDTNPALGGPDTSPALGGPDTGPGRVMVGEVGERPGGSPVLQAPPEGDSPDPGDEPAEQKAGAPTLAFQPGVAPAAATGTAPITTPEVPSLTVPSR